MNDPLVALARLLETLRPFVHAVERVDSVFPGLADDTPCRAALPALWPNLGELRRLAAAAQALAPVVQEEEDS